LRNKIIWIVSIIGVGVLGYFGFVAFQVLTFSGWGPCGMDDGQFNGVLIEKIEKSEFAQVYELENGQLILENRNDTLSPILSLVENGITKWTIDTDVRNTLGKENYRIWEISEVSIIDGTDPIKLNFIGHWTYGAEFGSMTIDRNTGNNKFCLSW